MSIINKYFYKEIYTNKFFRIRLHRFYPDTLKYKKRSWKKYFFNVTWCIRRMKERYNFNYLRGNVVKQHEIFSNSFDSYSNLLYNSADKGELSLVQESIRIGGDKILPQHYEYGIIYAAFGGYLDIVKYLVSIYKHVPPLAKTLAIKKSHSDVLAYLMQVEKQIEYKN